MILHMLFGVCISATFREELVCISANKQQGEIQNQFLTELKCDMTRVDVVA